MHIESHNIQLINEKYMEILSPDGLKCLIYPVSGAVQSCVSLAVNFGSFDTLFEANQSVMMGVPLGMAHFVEHYKFQNTRKNGTSLFSATGAHANAFTAHDRTVFFFKSHDNLTENLNILLNHILVNTNDVNMQSIKDVICEEIVLYSNDPVEKGRLLLFKELFPNHPVTVDIAGTEDLVRSVDQCTVDAVLEALYVPKNMVLSIAGNVAEFEPDVLSTDLIHVNRSAAKPKLGTLMQDSAIPKLRDKIVKLNHGMYASGFLIGVRPLIVEQQSMNCKVLDEIFFDIVAGLASELQLSWFNKGELNEELAIEVDYARNIGFTIITGVSKKADKIYEDLKEKIHAIMSNGVSEDAFAKSRMAIWGRYVTILDDGFEICNFLTSSFFYNGTIGGILNFISTLTFEELNAHIRNARYSENMAMVVLS